MSEESAQEATEGQKPKKQRKYARQDLAVRWKWVIFFAALGPLAFAMRLLFASDPELADQWFGHTIYPITGSGVSIMTAWLPVAMADVLIVFFVLWPIALIVKAVLHAISGSRSIPNLFKRGFARVISLGGLFFFLFHILWGFNYQRPPIAEALELPELSEDSFARLKALESLLEDTVEAVNRDRGLLGKTDSALEIAERTEFFDQARMRVDEFARQSKRAKAFPEWDGHFGNPKGSYFSPLLAKFGVMGIYIPFTGEPMVSKEIPDCLVPFIALHEIAHQRGIAREDDASYFAWMVSRKDDQSRSAESNRLMRYSVNLEMLWLCYAALRKMPEVEQAKEMLEEYILQEGPEHTDQKPSYQWNSSALNPGVVADLKAIVAYHQANQGQLASAGRKINDRFLKASGQEKGVASYGGVVDLVLRERSKR